MRHVVSVMVNLFVQKVQAMKDVGIVKMHLIIYERISDEVVVIDAVVEQVNHYHRLKTKDHDAKLRILYCSFEYCSKIERGAVKKILWDFHRDHRVQKLYLLKQ